VVTPITPSAVPDTANVWGDMSLALLRRARKSFRAELRQLKDHASAVAITHINALMSRDGFEPIKSLRELNEFANERGAHILRFTDQNDFLTTFVNNIIAPLRIPIRPEADPDEEIIDLREPANRLTVKVLSETIYPLTSNTCTDELIEEIMRKTGYDELSSLSRIDATKLIDFHFPDVA
jgi:hypothetical protein